MISDMISLARLEDEHTALQMQYEELDSEYVALETKYNKLRQQHSSLGARYCQVLHELMDLQKAREK